MSKICFLSIVSKHPITNRLCLETLLSRHRQIEVNKKHGWKYEIIDFHQGIAKVRFTKE